MSIHEYPTVLDLSTAHMEYRIQDPFMASCSAAAPYGVASTLELPTRLRYRKASGVRTPGWKRMRNEGILLPMTPWDRLEIDAEVELGARSWCEDSSNRFNTYHNYYWYPGDFGALSAWPTRDWMAFVGEVDLQYYVQKAASAIYSSGWDAGTFLAEIGQLRRMLSGAARKLDRLSRGGSAGELHDLWLEGRYGWRTLMYDIRDLHEVLSQSNERRTRYRETKGFTTSGLWNSGVQTHSSALIAKWSTSVSWSINMRGTVVADIDIPDFQFNPVTTLWEITRLSFVVDWLLNVGQALEAASFLLMVKDYRACGGYKVDFDVVSTSWLDSMSAGISNGTHTGAQRGQVSIMKRVPTTVDAYPRLKLRLDEFKVIDLLALIRQRLS